MNLIKTDLSYWWWWSFWRESWWGWSSLPLPIIYSSSWHPLSIIDISAWYHHHHHQWWRWWSLWNMDDICEEYTSTICQHHHVIPIYEERPNTLKLFDIGQFHMESLALEPFVYKSFKVFWRKITNFRLYVYSLDTK